MKALVTRRAPSVPNPKFASLNRIFGANFGFDKDTSKYMILVCFMNAKFVKASAAKSHELRIQHTSAAFPKFPSHRGDFFEEISET